MASKRVQMQFRALWHSLTCASGRTAARMLRWQLTHQAKL